MRTSYHKLPRLFLGLAVALSLFIGHNALAAGPTVRLTVTPSSVGLTADQSATLQVLAVDANGVTTDVTGSTAFTTNDPRGTFTGATYNPGKVGLWSIGVRADGQNASVAVTVTAGKLAELQINPNSAPERVALGTTRTYTVQGFDADNNNVAIPSPVWSVTKALGSISAAAVFTPSAEGTGTITVSSGEVKASVDLEVFKRPAVVLGPLTNSGNGNGDSNSNTNGNENTNTSTNGNSNINTSDLGTTGTTTTICSARKNWVWGLVLLAILGGTALLYAFVSVLKIWPAALALGVAAIAALLEHRYGCSTNWWAWVAVLGTAALTGFAYQQSPKQQN